MALLSKAQHLFGNSNARELKRLRPVAEAITAWEPQVQALPDEALRARADEFRQRLEDGAALDDLLPEAFAVVREAAHRWLAMRHFDVQLLGGAVLHQGKIAEMRTGEGKTLGASLPLYLNAPGGGRRPPDHRQRLPRQARRPLDGAHLPRPRPQRGRPPAPVRLPL